MIAGRRETFAIEARALVGAPPEGDGAAASTWTALRFYAAGRNLFRNVHAKERHISDDVNWPAIGIARWFVRSWDALFHPAPWPRPCLCRNARDFGSFLDDALAEDLDCPDEDLDVRDAFVATHSLRSAAAGAALPDVWFIRDADVVSIAWHDSMDGEVFFTLSRGEVDIPARDFALAVRDFVRWVHGLVEDRSASDARLLGDWLSRFESPTGALDGLLHETGLGGDRWRRVASAAGLLNPTPALLLGLEPQALDAGTMINASVSTIALAFRCASPTLSDDELAALRKTIIEVPRNETGFAKLAPVNQPDKSVWIIGALLLAGRDSVPPRIARDTRAPHPAPLDERRAPPAP